MSGEKSIVSMEGWLRVVMASSIFGISYSIYWMAIAYLYLWGTRSCRTFMYFEKFTGLMMWKSHVEQMGNSRRLHGFCAKKPLWADVFHQISTGLFKKKLIENLRIIPKKQDVLDHRCEIAPDDLFVITKKNIGPSCIARRSKTYVHLKKQTNVLMTWWGHGTFM